MDLNPDTWAVQRLIRYSAPNLTADDLRAMLIEDDIFDITPGTDSGHVYAAVSGVLALAGQIITRTGHYANA